MIDIQLLRKDPAGVEKRLAARGPGAFDADQSRAVLTAAAARGLGLRVHGNQLGFGPGVALAVV